MCDGIRGDGVIQTGNISEQLLAGSVDFHAHRVHAGHHGVVELALQGVWIDIVLTLPHADGFRIDLNQLRQRIHQAPTNGHGAAHRDILVREFLAATSDAE